MRFRFTRWCLCRIQYIARRSLDISYTYHGIEINLEDKILILRRYYMQKIDRHYLQEI